MFAPPPLLSPQPFARLPAELDLSASTAPGAWLQQRSHYGTPGSFLEGPAFDREGRLYCVDVAHGRILCVDRDGRFSVVLHYDGAPNGLAIHRDGRLFVADHLRGLLVVDPATAACSVLLDGATGAFGAPFKGLNDLTFARNGDLYFTDQGQTGLQDPSGRLFRLRADTRRLELVLDGIPSPNGLAFNRDESALWLAVTRAAQVWKLPLMKDGRVTKAGVFLHLQGGGPDGLAAGADDSLWVAQPGLGCVWGFSAHGEPLLRIDTAGGGRMPTNLAFGCPDGDQLYFVEASAGVVYRAHVGVEGLALFSHQPVSGDEGGARR